MQFPRGAIVINASYASYHLDDGVRSMVLLAIHHRSVEGNWSHM